MQVAALRECFCLDDVQLTTYLFVMPCIIVGLLAYASVIDMDSPPRSMYSMDVLLQLCGCVHYTLQEAKLEFISLSLELTLLFNE